MFLSDWDHRNQGFFSRHGNYISHRPGIVSPLWAASKIPFQYCYVLMIDLIFFTIFMNLLSFFDLPNYFFDNQISSKNPAMVVYFYNSRQEDCKFDVSLGFTVRAFNNNNKTKESNELKLKIKAFPTAECAFLDFQGVTVPAFPFLLYSLREHRVTSRHQEMSTEFGTSPSLLILRIYDIYKNVGLVTHLPMICNTNHCVTT